MILNKKEALSDVKNFLVDGGYGGENFSTKIKNIISATVTIAKRSKLDKFAMIPQRWIVERSFGWIEKSRRLWKSCERKISTSLQWLYYDLLDYC